MIFIRLNFLFLLLLAIVMAGCVKDKNPASQLTDQIGNSPEIMTDRGDPEELPECEYFIRINSVSPSTATYYLVVKNLADNKVFFTACNNSDSDPCGVGTGFLNGNLNEWYKLNIPSGATNIAVDLGAIYNAPPGCGTASSGANVSYSIKGNPMPFPTNFYTKTLTYGGWGGPVALHEYSINNSTCVILEEIDE